MAGPELSAFKTAALASGQTNPVTDLIQQTVDFVRGYIAACPSNTLGVEGTVPDKLLGTVLDILVVEVEKRCAGKLIDPQGLRAEAARNAMSVLRDVAAGRMRVEIPTTATSEVLASFVPTISSTKPRHPAEDGI